VSDQKTRAATFGIGDTLVGATAVERVGLKHAAARLRRLNLGSPDCPSLSATRRRRTIPLHVGDDGRRRCAAAQRADMKAPLVVRGPEGLTEPSNGLILRLGRPGDLFSSPREGCPDGG